MKELSIEQKATAYEDLLKKAKQYYDTENDVIVLHFLEELFPELCESEDEKVKEDIISLVNEFWERIGSINPEYSSRSRMLAWLEKQGEPTDNDMVEALRTEYEKGRADVIAEMQKHNDAIKPRFNVGDYIVSNSGLKYYITGIFKGYYMTESGCIITLDAQDNYKVYNNFWSKEEEELLNNICNLLQNPDSIKANQHVIGNIVDWLKSIKDRVQPRQEWSKEDECTLNGILDDYKSMCKTYRNWLESLKNRIQPQQKQEWSEEDEVKINRIVACLENLNVADNDILLKDVDWLKSLKDRYFWKPSDEQMDSLEYIIDNIQHLPYSCSVAKELLEQLKKIKGE